MVRGARSASMARVVGVARAPPGASVSCAKGEGGAAEYRVTTKIACCMSLNLPFRNILLQPRPLASFSSP